MTAFILSHFFGILLGPKLVAAAMNLSSVSAIAHALRLRLAGPEKASKCDMGVSFLAGWPKPPSGLGS